MKDDLNKIIEFQLLLAHETGIDIKKSFKNKMKVNAKKYPVHKAHGNSKKYNEL